MQWLHALPVWAVVICLVGMRCRRSACAQHEERERERAFQREQRERGRAFQREQRERGRAFYRKELALQREHELRMQAERIKAMQGNVRSGDAGRRLVVFESQ
eukprot:1152250-Pelagomonas_calceolata.AAC.2